MTTSPTYCYYSDIQDLPATIFTGSVIDAIREYFPHTSLIFGADGMNVPRDGCVFALRSNRSVEILRRTRPVPNHIWVACASNYICIQYEHDTRPNAAKCANLYYDLYTSLERGEYLIPTPVSTLVCGRPYRSHLRIVDHDNIRDLEPRLVARRPYNPAVAIRLGRSEEIQYCAWSAGIPYEICVIIEFIILAIL